MTEWFQGTLGYGIGWLTATTTASPSWRYRSAHRLAVVTET